MKLKLAATTFVSLLAAQSSYATDPVDRGLLVPGERAEFISKTTTEEELRKIVGADNMKRRLYPTEEGDYYCVTEIFPNSNYDVYDSQQALVIVWGSDQTIYAWGKDGKESIAKCEAMPSFTKPLYVVAEGKSSYWHTAENVRVGDSFAELEKANHAPVTFESCECCGNGAILDWHKGKLSTQPKLHITMQEYEITEKLEKYRDNGVSSTELPRKLKDEVKIGRITIDLNR